MPSKEEFYHSVLKDRRILDDPSVLECTCPYTLCEWHGRCRECVAIHRYNADHVPTCMQPMLRDKLIELAGVAELSATPKNIPPVEYHLYVRTRDKLKTK